MTIAWMVYTVLVTTLLLAGAFAAEFVCRALRRSIRFVWAAAFALSTTLSASSLIVSARSDSAARSVTVLDAGSSASGANALPNQSLHLVKDAVPNRIAALAQSAAD